MATERLPDDVGRASHKFFNPHFSVANKSVAGHVMRFSIAIAVTALVRRNYAIPGYKASCRFGPLTCIPRQAMK